MDGSSELNTGGKLQDVAQPLETIKPKPPVKVRQSDVGAGLAHPTFRLVGEYKLSCVQQLYTATPPPLTAVVRVVHFNSGRVAGFDQRHSNVPPDPEGQADWMLNAIERHMPWGCHLRIVRGGRK